VLEHDGFIFGCAALYPFPSAGMGELACLTVHPEYAEYGDGERLLKRIEHAPAPRPGRLFVLTTRTAHWFLKRGFALADIDRLPLERQHLYNWQRRSQILVKSCRGRFPMARMSTASSSAESRGSRLPAGAGRTRQEAVGERQQGGLGAWQKHQTMLVNENRLNLADARAAST